MFFSTQENQNFGSGQLGDTPSSFVYKWTSIYDSWGNSGLNSQTHARINDLLQQNFPKLLYSIPYSSWTTGFFERDSVYMTGESGVSPTTTKSVLDGILDVSGIKNVSWGKVEFDQLPLGSDQWLKLPKEVLPRLPSKPYGDLPDLVPDIKDVPELLGATSGVLLFVGAITLFLLLRD